MHGRDPTKVDTNPPRSGPTADGCSSTSIRPYGYPYLTIWLAADSSIRDLRACGSDGVGGADGLTGVFGSACEGIEAEWPDGDCHTA